MPPERATADLILRNGWLATMRPGTKGVGLVERGALAISDGRILAVGEEPGLLGRYAAREVIDLEGRLVTPGLIDCHTHLVHAGHRAGEFERRLGGVSYAQIVKEGGGIRSTVRATRNASEDALVESALPRLDALIAEGVTTIEIKSGYGLDLETETRMLRASRHLADRRDIAVATTYLGAHAVAPEFGKDGDLYLDYLCNDWLPAIHGLGLADAVDGFCETIAFSPEQIARVLAAAKAHGMPVKLHADQLSNLHGARLAASYGALSADHLEYTDADGAAAMARSGTTAVLLPGAFYFLGERQVPPVRTLRAHGVPLAVATDCNPGTSPLTSILLAMNMAAVLFRLTPEECLAGVTREAARALGRLGSVGTLEAGKLADLAVWDVDQPAELVYRMGFNPLHARIWRGRWPEA